MLAAKLLGAARHTRPQLAMMTVARTASSFLQPTTTRLLHSSRPVLAQSFDDNGMPRLQDTPVNIVRPATLQ
ncbi:hypothetical protein JG687_00010867 [Phytophthora cactorum]|uniref:Uncharacterized protein n=1 Tax=Phytophthora cactorum TaxID=29920 RepID=A0A8T1U639_9STRA|nr:hypothetical protein JG687_00010867 [Phytophthora cactorum]